jgi:hypothetical protein
MLTELSRRDWPRFFDRVSAALAARAVTVYAAGLDGAREEEWMPLGALSYDAGEGELRFLLGGRTVVRRDFLVLRHPLPVVGASA